MDTVSTILNLVLAGIIAYMSYLVYNFTESVNKYREEIQSLKTKAVKLQDENNSLKNSLKIFANTEKQLNKEIAEYESKIKKISDFFKV
mgnify:CR=1 FL=1